jgi:hypothetical protein
MTGSVITGNRQLAARARDLAARATDTTDRKAALCCAVAFDTTRTVMAARKVLDRVTQHHIRQAAIELLGDITGEANT